MGLAKLTGISGFPYPVIVNNRVNGPEWVATGFTNWQKINLPCLRVNSVTGGGIQAIKRPGKAPCQVG